MDEQVINADVVVEGQQAENPVVQVDGEQPIQQENAENAVNPDKEVSETEPVGLTDDDILEGIESEKSNVQKRFDKLTAEKYAKDDQIKELEEKLANIEKKVNGGKPKYSMEQLDLAIKTGIEEGDSSLVTEAINHKMQLAIESAVEKYEEPHKKEQSDQDRRNGLWSSFVNSLNTKDPDYDFANPTSAAYKYTQYFLTSPEYKEHYSKFGIYSAVQAGNDAIRIITEQKSKKRLDGKLKSTTKDLAKERMKSQGVYSSAYVTPDTETNQQTVRIVDSNVDDNLREFLKYRENMGAVKKPA